METVANTHDLAKALANSDIIFDRATLEQAIRRMAVEMRADYGNDDVPVYLTIMHGGLPFAAQLAMEVGALGLDLEFDYLHATRYRGATSGGDLVWKHRPATPLNGRRVLLDTHYVSTWSLPGDVLILLRTVKVVFSQSGSY